MKQLFHNILIQRFKYLRYFLLLLSLTFTSGIVLADKKAGEINFQNEVCAEFAKDLNADLGKVMEAGCEPTLAQMSALMDNPLGNVAMLFTQFDLYRMENKSNNKEANQGVYTGILQFPKKLNDDWNLINRVIWTVPSVPLDNGKINDYNPGPGGSGSGAPIDAFDGRTTGFGDMYYVGLFSPSAGIDVDWGEGKILWGAGFDIAAPTAEHDILGSDKWSAGPSALAVYMGPDWKVGGLATHYWDFAGDDDADDVNMTNLQYFVFWSLSETESIGASPNIIIDWEQDTDNRYSVPIGIGYTKTIKMGKMPVRFGIELHKYIVQPDDIPGPDWGLRLYIIPAVPSAMFGWMQ